MPRKPGIPKYCLHKASGRAVVRIDGFDHYLGVYGSEESKANYDRLIAEWLARGRQSNVDQVDELPPTINEIIVTFWEHALVHYRKPDGTHTQEIVTLKQAIKPLAHLYGELQGEEFGPRALKAVRQKMVESGWCRSHINKQISRIKSIFRWSAEEEMVSGSVYHALRAVRGLQKGRTEAPESEPVRPVPDADIEAIHPYVSRQVWALIQLQLFTGARPGELIRLRPTDIETRGEVWTVNLDEHKTAHHGHTRRIYFGPEAQKTIGEFMADRPLNAYLFSPQEAEMESRARRHKRRNTPMSCGNRPGSNRRSKPRRRPGHCYTVDSYRRAIQRGCDQAFPPPHDIARRKGETERGWLDRLTDDQKNQLKQWRKDHRWHPHQLRHNAATRIRRERGIDAARAILGHRCLTITDVYAEIDQAVAIEAASRLG